MIGSASAYGARGPPQAKRSPEILIDRTFNEKEKSMLGWISMAFDIAQMFTELVLDIIGDKGSKQKRIAFAHGGDTIDFVFDKETDKITEHNKSTELYATTAFSLTDPSKNENKCEFILLPPGEAKEVTKQFEMYAQGTASITNFPATSGAGPSTLVALYTTKYLVTGVTVGFAMGLSFQVLKNYVLVKNNSAGKYKLRFNISLVPPKASFTIEGEIGPRPLRHEGASEIEIPYPNGIEVDSLIDMLSLEVYTEDTGPFIQALS